MFYVIAQIIGILGMVMNIVSYQAKKQRNIILIQFFGCSLFAVNMFMLGAYTGAFCSFFTALMVFCCSFKGKNKLFSGLFIPIVFNIGFIILEIFTWVAIPTLIQMAGNIILVFAMWSDREIDIKALFIPVGVLWFIYNLIYFSWIGLICQALAVSFNVFFVVRYFIRKNKSKQGPL